jgi:hypothetical protein
LKIFQPLCPGLAAIFGTVTTLSARPISFSIGGFAGRVFSDAELLSSSTSAVLVELGGEEEEDEMRSEDVCVRVEVTRL